MLRTLHEAVLKVSAFYLPHKGREKSPLSGIRLIPKSGPYPSRVFATKGTTSILIDVEGDLPNLVVDAVGVEAAVRADPAAKVWIEGDLVVVGRYRFRPWCEVGVYPGFPAIPGDEYFQTIPESRLFSKVVHAVGADPSRPELHYVSLRPGIVEAADSIRLVRVPMQINRTVRIHASVFEEWPGGEVGLAVEESVGAVFRWPGEVRWGLVYDEKSRSYPNLARVEVDGVTVTEAVVPVGALRSTLRKATTASPLRAVTVQFAPGAVDLYAAKDMRNTRIEGYHDRVPALCHGQGEVTVRGDFLAQALHAADTPRVLMGISAGSSALQVRSGSFLEYIYPMRA